MMLAVIELSELPHTYRASGSVGFPIQRAQPSRLCSLSGLTHPIGLQIYLTLSSMMVNFQVLKSTSTDFPIRLSATFAI